MSSAISLLHHNAASFIAQLPDSSSAEWIGFFKSAWKCIVIHEAPTDKSCESLANPIAGEAPCDFRQLEEPVLSKDLNFDDSAWPNAIEHSSAAIDPKRAYAAMTGTAMQNYSARATWKPITRCSAVLQLATESRQ